MIGRLVLSDRNIFKIKYGGKQVSARKCYILSETNENILIKTSKEFNPKDEYVKIDKKTNTILEGYGTVGDFNNDLGIYFHMLTLGWMSESKYSKLWDTYLFKNQNELINFDLIEKTGLERILYTNQVITIDPDNSIDLDDGFSFSSDNDYYWIDIHIADPVSWFDLTNPLCHEILKEIYIRQQSCYISLLNSDNKFNKPTHLLPPKVVQIISLLELNENKINSKRAISFCFKISKQTKLIENFNLKFSNLTNIKNYSYDKYDNEINDLNNLENKKELVNLSNDLIKIIGLSDGFETISLNSDISHKMIEIFMILTNWYGGNYLINDIHWKKTILRTQMKNQFDDEFNITNVPIWARPILSKSANYQFGEEENKNLHYSLGITNYSHMSSPMRRFVDMLNHFGLYRLNPCDFTNFNLYNLEQINKTVKYHKKVSNGYDLLRFIKANLEHSDDNNKFKACLFDFFEQSNNNNGIKCTLVLYQEEYKFIRVVNVELPQTELTNVSDKLKKYMVFEVKLYYNSNNFKSPKFPFSIKII